MKLISPQYCLLAARSVFQFRKIYAVCAVVLVIALLPGSAFAKKKAPDHPIDLNAANEKELQELPGVGPTTAKAIVDFREKSGKIKRVDDLLVIRGISEAKLAKIRPYVVIGPPPAKSSGAQPQSPPKTAIKKKGSSS
jgi:competence ComEA-like helix-hairpin-helix protein